MRLKTDRPSSPLRSDLPRDCKYVACPLRFRPKILNLQQLSISQYPRTLHLTPTGPITPQWPNIKVAFSRSQMLHLVRRFFDGPR